MPLLSPLPDWVNPSERSKFKQTYALSNLTSPTRFGLVGTQTISYIKLAGTIQFAISPNAYIKLNATIAQSTHQFVNLAATIKSANNFGFINLAGQIQIKTRNYIKLNGTIAVLGRNYIKLNSTIALSTRQYIKLNATIIQKLSPSLISGTISDSAFIKLAAYIINPPSQNDSVQMPGQGFTKQDDWLSSSDALASYKPGSRFTLSGGTLPAGGISIVVTAFTAGVVSFQTRTRTWLRRVDQASGGVLTTTKVNTHTLPNGTILTTTTTVTQNKDVTTTTVVIQNSGTPTRTSTVVTEKYANGQVVIRETETDTIAGTVNSLIKKTVATQPPTNDNIQPIQVRTLDGNVHYQFFDKVNPAWAGGEQEGVTSTQKSVQIVPGTLNGQTTDPFGNLIYNQITDETETDPNGKITHVHTEEIGTRKDIGTITTDTTDTFQGIQSTEVKTTTYPDGSKKVTTTVTNPQTGDKVAVTIETVTDEFGQVTTTQTTEETKTFTDPTTGNPRQTVTKTVAVTKGAVTTTDSTVETTNDYEDDIIRNKIKVYFIQEFTITCVIDELNMEALSEVNMSHQRNYALLELFGQQLGNASLSYNLRQQFINQFNNANAAIAPINLLALNRNYQVVFAQSASGFRAKYIPGTEPHVYELQMILQSRSDLMNGAFGG